MAKQVQVLIICDWCKRKWSDEDEEAPEERDWTWNGVDYLVELCNPCMDKVRDLLQPLFSASEQKRRRGPGRPPSGRNYKRRSQSELPRGSFEKYKNEEGKYICPQVDQMSGTKCERSFDYPQHLGNHHNRMHGSLLS
jgi:hypothetical protein